MNILLFLATLIVSVIAVRIGAVAFNLTGLEWSVAKFQSLSCFTGTGFTTRESELILASPRRRRIATYLIVIGHAGFVALIATFANSIRPSLDLTRIDLPFLKSFVPAQLLPLINLLIIAGAVYALVRILPHTRLARKVTTLAKKKLVGKKIVSPEKFEEIFVAPGGYGVSRVDIEASSPVLGKSLAEADLRKHGITVLVIERGLTTIPNPPPDARIISGDVLLCFGKLSAMKDEIYTLSGDHDREAKDGPS
ncbi:MAG: TrkA C-terminal domain-containing protein [Candidatus Erginobacter occultus]|nr:TrkA C-terminal domain-containing protein [Candidatus Erginobacter occultus]